MKKRFTKFIGFVLIAATVFFGYLGVTNTDKGDPNHFIVNDTLKVEVNNTESYLTFSFYNISKEEISEAKVIFGIKNDRNYTNEKDEITVTLTNYQYNEDKSFDLVFNKDSFRTGGKNYTTPEVDAYVHVGLNITVIGEYDYVHSIEVEGKEKNFNHGEKSELQYYIFAAISLIGAVFMVIRARKMPDVVKVSKGQSIEIDNTIKEEWDNNPEEIVEEKKEEVKVELSPEDQEEQQKFIDSMEVIDMDKDELE